VVYYFYAFANLRSGDDSDSIIFSVPSGNFGDMMGGVIAREMGLPVSKFIIAVNENDEFPEFLNSGRYSKLEPSKNCLSNAMNVGHPSNLARLVELYGGFMDEKGEVVRLPNLERMRRDLYSQSVTDNQTRETIREAFNSFGVLFEPHGAVGFRVLRDYMESENIPENQLAVTLETAHPAKFPDEIREILNIDPELPASLIGLEEREEFCSALENNYTEFKKYLISNYS
jgi:threonine synthase